MITFQGHQNLRLRVILATLSGKTIKIEKIRSDDLNPGLKDFEVSFLRLMDSVTNGSKIEISYTGTTVIFKPGIIIGGSLVHNCPESKPVGYFIEYMLYIAPFSKKKFSIIFKGVTAAKGEVGLEGIRWGLLPIMEKFGVRECALHTLKRGSPPNGGGEVHLIVDSLIPQPLTMHAFDVPKITGIRGVAYCTRVSPSVVNRMIDSARTHLRSTNCETKITADVWRGENSGKSPGWGIALFTESKGQNSGWTYLAEDIGLAGDVPEDLASTVALQLLDEISDSGVVCNMQLSLALVYMVIGKEDVGRLRISKAQVAPTLIHTLRDIKSVFGTEAVLKETDELVDGDSDGIIVAIKGVGFTNASKKIA